MFVLLVLLFFSFRYRIEFDPDEGINAIKAAMVLRGFDLYREIWSDQPPFFTFLLAGWFQAFGLKLTAGRLLVLLFSASIVALGGFYVRRAGGVLAAACAAVLLFLLPFYLRLSVSMMIGLPAIALALASFVLLAEWHARPTTARLVGSAVLLGLSVLTKAFTVILLPIWVVGITAAVLRDPGLQATSRRRWLWPAIWLLVFAIIVGAAAFFVVGTANLPQLVDVHLQASQTDILPEGLVRRSLESYLAESIPVLLLAALGAWFALRRKEWTALYLAAWIVAGYALLAITRPTWYHHQLLITVPAALLGSIGIAGSIDLLRRRPAGRAGAPEFAVGLVGVGLLLACVVTRVPGTVEGLDSRLPNLRRPADGEEAERSLVALLSDHAAETRWLYTDRPIFAFLADLPVPPNLAVLSQKRLLTGQLTQEEIISTLEAYSPEMILNGRFTLPAVEAYMRTRNFTRIDSTEKYRLYLRRPGP
jgi:4-amino-4-deoxy-L-arabinose transferase-like glycosyltransferase